MKTKLMFLILGLITLWSCQSIEEDLLSIPDSQFQKQGNLSASEEAVIAKVMASRYGGYNKLQPDTRSLSDFILTPYVEEGDTLLYIVQFPEGWELYTAKTPLPMLVLSCEEGTFNILDPEMPDPLRTTLDNLIAELKQLDSSATSTGVTSSENLQANDNVKSEVFVVKPDNSVMTISESDLPPGHWILLSQTDTNIRSYTSPKLIKTKWGQDSPWNKYAKWVIDTNDGSKVQAPAGCTPVAVGQYQYYTHFKDGVPKFAASKARATSDGMDYTFPLASQTIWTTMALSKSSVTGFNEVAMLLGDIGRELKSDYQINGTPTLDANIVPYLKKIYSKEFEEKSYSNNAIMNQIDNSYPVITTAKQVKGTELSGHCFIIDKYSKTECTTQYVYGWQRDPLPPEVKDIWDQDLKDSNGNIIKYAYQKTITEENLLQFGVSMNWGVNGSYDSIVYYLSDDWNPGDNNYDRLRTLYIPK